MGDFLGGENGSQRSHVAETPDVTTCGLITVTGGGEMSNTAATPRIDADRDIAAMAPPPAQQQQQQRLRHR